MTCSKGCGHCAPRLPPRQARARRRWYLPIVPWLSVRGNVQQEKTMRCGRVVLVLLLVAAPSVALAQNPNPLTANAKVQFGALSGFVVRSAEKVPEGLYNFRPTA